MQTNVNVRIAQIPDALITGELIRTTLYGFGTYLIGLGKEQRAGEVLTDYFRLPDNRYSYQFSFVAMMNNEIAGLLVAFPGKKLSRLNWNTNWQMLKVYNLKEIFQFIRRALILRDEEEVNSSEFYIANLAVSLPYRRKGIGRALLAYAEELARENRLGKLSLMAEIENRAAIDLYERAGFKIVKTYEHPKNMSLVGSPGYVKMIKML